MPRKILESYTGKKRQVFSSYIPLRRKETRRDFEELRVSVSAVQLILLFSSSGKKEIKVEEKTVAQVYMNL